MFLMGSRPHFSDGQLSYVCQNGPVTTVILWNPTTRKETLTSTASPASVDKPLPRRAGVIGPEPLTRTFVLTHLGSFLYNRTRGANRIRRDHRKMRYHERLHCLVIFRKMRAHQMWSQL